MLTFNNYGANEYLTAVAIAREQSRHVRWTEVRDEENDGAVRCRYRNGYPERGQDARVWREDRLSHQRYGAYVPAGWDDQWP